MTLLPPDKLRFDRHSYVSALGWLALVYRRPERFCEMVDEYSGLRKIGITSRIFAHLLPFIVVIITTIRIIEYARLSREYAPVSRECDCVLFFKVHGLNLILNMLLGTLSLGEMILSLAIYGFLGGIGVGVIVGLLVSLPIIGRGKLAWGCTCSIFSATIASIIGGGFNGESLLFVAYLVGAGAACPVILSTRNEIRAGDTFNRLSMMKVPALIALSGAAFSFSPGESASSKLIILGTIIGIVLGSRLYYFPVHQLYIWPDTKGAWYPTHPVAWDDLCDIPFPGLDKVLAAYTVESPEVGEREIDRLIDTYPSQRDAALQARVRVVARRLARQADLGRLDELASRIPEGKRNFLYEAPRVREWITNIARQQRHLDAVPRPIFREPLARALRSDIENFQSRVAGLNEPVASEFRAAAERWLIIAEEQWQRTRAVVEREPTPQVFIAGTPVNRQREAFVPRNAVIGEIEAQVMLAAGCPGLVLYGRRRTGKTTAVRNLDGFLSPTVHITNISMENPLAFTSLTDFVHLVAEAVGAAWPTASDTLSTANLASLFTILARADSRLLQENRRLILVIDEYEYIDAKIGEGVFPRDLLAMLRESIQTHRHIIWMFVGGHDIAELIHAPWPSYLVSARTITMPLFSLAETRLLLTEPLAHSPLFRNNDISRPRFSADLWGECGIERIQAEAAGWPHLVQLLAETIVGLLNEGVASRANAILLDIAIAKAVGYGDAVLRQLVEGESRLPGELDYVRGFRRNDTQPPPDDGEIRRSLRHRLLVTEENGLWRLRVPLMHRWLREHG